MIFVIYDFFFKVSIFQNLQFYSNFLLINLVILMNKFLFLVKKKKGLNFMIMMFVKLEIYFFMKKRCDIAKFEFMQNNINTKT